MFYTWSLSHNKELPIPINNNNYFISLHTYTTLFAWGDGSLNKMDHRNTHHLYYRN